jgi:fucose 4-O-acetylase-like acetyltransferase
LYRCRIERENATAMRNAGIDAAKGIGILLVVLGHSRLAPADGALHRVIFSFHMPLFFVLAGVFLRAGDGLLPAARARALALLAPYFAVSLGVALYRLPRMVAAPDWPETAGRLIAGVLHGTGASIPWAPLWFLPHLFIAGLAALALAKLIGGPRRELAAGALLLSAGATALDTGAAPVRGLPWSADLLPVSVGFVLLGHAFGPVLRGGLDRSVVLAAAAGFAALHLGSGAAMDLNMRQYGSPAVATLEALCGVVLVLGVASGLAATPAGAALAWLGARTMPVLLFHWFLLAAVFAALSDRGAGPAASALASLAAACLLPAFGQAAAVRIATRLKARRGAAPGARTGPDGAEKNLS